MQQCSTEQRSTVQLRNTSTVCWGCYQNQ